MSGEYFSIEVIRSTGPIGTVTNDDSTAFFEYAKVLQKLLVEFCPVNKNPRAANRGSLRRSIRQGARTDFADEASVSYEALDYVGAVLSDTKAHKIEAKPGSALSFDFDLSQSFHGPFSRGEHGSPVPQAPKIRARSLPTNFAFSAAGRSARSVAAPRDRPYLHNQAGGATSVSRAKGRDSDNKIAMQSVQHPGTKGNDFVGKALEASEPAMSKLFDQIADHLDLQVNQYFSAGLLHR